jgi:hypothetical protein
MGVACHVVYEPKGGGRPLLAAVVDDPALVRRAVDLAVQRAFEDAQIVGEFDPLLGQVKQGEAERMEQVLRKLTQGFDTREEAPSSKATQPPLAKPVGRKPGDDWLFIDELALALNCKASWIYSQTRLKGKGQMPHAKVAGRLRFKLTEVLDHLKSQRG